MIKRKANKSRIRETRPLQRCTSLNILFGHSEETNGVQVLPVWENNLLGSVFQTRSLVSSACRSHFPFSLWSSQRFLGLSAPPSHFLFLKHEQHGKSMSEKVQRGNQLKQQQQRQKAHVRGALIFRQDAHSETKGHSTTVKLRSRAVRLKTRSVITQHMS